MQQQTEVIQHTPKHGDVGSETFVPGRAIWKCCTVTEREFTHHGSKTRQAGTTTQMEDSRRGKELQGTDRQYWFRLDENTGGFFPWRHILQLILIQQNMMTHCTQTGNQMKCNKRVDTEGGRCGGKPGDFEPEWVGMPMKREA